MPATLVIIFVLSIYMPLLVKDLVQTARRLNLHSDSSYRFERGLDPQGVDWASRRTCEE